MGRNENRQERRRNQANFNKFLEQGPSTNQAKSMALGSPELYSLIGLIQIVMHHARKLASASCDCAIL
jgi:hypothetical protein